MSRVVLPSEPDFAAWPAAAQRFLTFPAAGQTIILHALRGSVFPEGVFSQVPAAEWLRLLHLVDPLIRPGCGWGEAYRVEEGRQLLVLLLAHYLDVR